jgi:hypothetical protein
MMVLQQQRTEKEKINKKQTVIKKNKDYLNRWYCLEPCFFKN